MEAGRGFRQGERKSERPIWPASSSLMMVTVVGVGIVRVGMRQPCVLMPVAMRFAARIAG
jgi:hypothetical protein